MSTLNIENLFGVKGYVALVTGGSSGLGFMICKVWLDFYQKTLYLCIINNERNTNGIHYRDWLPMEPKSTSSLYRQSQLRKR